MRSELQQQLHQLAATAATQWVTTELGYVAGAAFTSAVHNATDPSYMAVFAPQLEAAHVARKADEAAKEATRQAVITWGSWHQSPRAETWAPSETWSSSGHVSGTTSVGLVWIICSASVLSLQV